MTMAASADYRLIKISEIIFIYFLKLRRSYQEFVVLKMSKIYRIIDQSKHLSFNSSKLK